MHMFTYIHTCIATCQLINECKYIFVVPTYRTFYFIGRQNNKFKYPPQITKELI